MQTAVLCDRLLGPFIFSPTQTEPKSGRKTPCDNLTPALKTQEETIKLFTQQPPELPFPSLPSHPSVPAAFPGPAGSEQAVTAEPRPGACP